MSSFTGASIVARTKSNRLPTPANSNKPISQYFQARVSSSSGTSTLSATSSAVAQQSSSPPGPSNLSLFLTNLRLLDFDSKPSWPNISALTFSTSVKDGGQKKRVYAVEWALYHLLVIWDPEEARNKLQPFFPPRDQVQSLNLRAALLRSLETAKKNGILGRDAVVRKTMLDECRGERLEEVLAALSSAVLKKLVVEQRLNAPSSMLKYSSVAQSLALEKRGYSGDRTELTVLILAHRSSLGCFLRCKNAARGRYLDFSRLLDAREKNMVERAEETKEMVLNGPDQSVADDTIRIVRRTVRNNWSGSERWLETLFYGDTLPHEDGLLSVPFDKVWQRVQSGRLSELEHHSDGLLDQLESRVRAQRERLEKWRSFSHRVFGDPTQDPVMTSSAKKGKMGIDLGFRAHETLQLGQLSQSKLTFTRPENVFGGYADLAKGLEETLSIIDRGKLEVLGGLKGVSQGGLPGPKREPSGSSQEEVVSDISGLEDQPLDWQQEQDEIPSSSFGLASQPISQRAPTIDTDIFSIKSSHSATGDIDAARGISREWTARSLETKGYCDDPAGPGVVSPARSSRREPSPASRSPTNPSPPSTRRRLSSGKTSSSPKDMPSKQVSPTQQLADQILASVEAASPSPVKKARHTLSLAERARLSMVRPSSTRAGASTIAELERDRLPLRRAQTSFDGPPAVPLIVDDEDDLVARTRRSMVGFEAAQKKAQVDRQRSLRRSRQLQGPPRSPSKRDRSSYFPPLDEEEEGMSMVLAEELMGSKQDDYDAVFRSRPRIKTSPPGSPIKAWEEQG